QRRNLQLLLCAEMAGRRLSGEPRRIAQRSFRRSVSWSSFRLAYGHRGLSASLKKLAREYNRSI
ncbi:MAG: hypothetical protein ACRETH_01660, partial [Steroidobacteraceae bacterium]